MEGMQISDASCVNVKHSNSISSLHFALRYSTLFKGGFEHEYIDDRWVGGKRLPLGGSNEGASDNTHLAAVGAAAAGSRPRFTAGEGAPAETAQLRAVGPWLRQPASGRQFRLAPLWGCACGVYTQLERRWRQAPSAPGPLTTAGPAVLLRRTWLVRDTGWLAGWPAGATWRVANTTFTCTGNITHELPAGAHMCMYVAAWLRGSFVQQLCVAQC